MVTPKREPSPYRRFYTKDADLHQWVKQARSQPPAPKKDDTPPKKG